MTPTEERQAWRTYAAAALQGIQANSTLKLGGDGGANAMVVCCVAAANLMLAAEKERFER
jgi:hypothetical protein